MLTMARICSGEWQVLKDDEKVATISRDGAIYHSVMCGGDATRGYRVDYSDSLPEAVEWVTEPHRQSYTSPALAPAPALPAANFGPAWEDWYQRVYLAGGACHCCGREAETSQSKWGPLCAICWSCPVNGCDVDEAAAVEND